MFKKVAVIAVVFVFSVITIFFAYIVALVDELEKYVDQLVTEERFEELYEFTFMYSIVSEDAIHIDTFDDGTVLYAYKSIAYFYNYDEDGIVTSYEMKEGMKFFFANIGEEFDFTNVSSVKAYNDTTEYLGEVESEYRIESYYAAYNVYSVIIETESWGNDNTFNNIVIYDTPEDDTDEAEAIVTIDLSSLELYEKIFTASESNNWDAVLTRANYYNTGKFVEDLVEEGKSTSEISNLCLEEEMLIVELLEETLEDSGFMYCYYDVTFLMQNSSFVFKVAVSVVCVILINLGMIFFLFIKPGRDARKKLAQNATNSKVKKQDVIDAK